MTHEEKRVTLIRMLLAERPGYRSVEIPPGEQAQKDLLRSLMNVRLPGPLTEEYIRIESEYLQEETARKGVTRLADLRPVKGDLYVWQGDITALACDAVVNAADSGMIGCFYPLHDCVDNRIHSAAGLRLRNCCHELIQKQGHTEPPGRARLTPAYNLPGKVILHTVGAIVNVTLGGAFEEQLISCYRSCLALAEESGCESLAFCSVSTEAFGPLQRRAAGVAVKTVKDWKAESQSGIKVIFNVLNHEERAFYTQLLKE